MKSSSFFSLFFFALFFLPPSYSLSLSLLLSSSPLSLFLFLSLSFFFYVLFFFCFRFSISLLFLYALFFFFSMSVSLFLSLCFCLSVPLSQVFKRKNTIAILLTSQRTEGQYFSSSRLHLSPVSEAADLSSRRKKSESREIGGNLSLFLFFFLFFATKSKRKKENNRDRKKETMEKERKWLFYWIVHVPFIHLTISFPKSRLGNLRNHSQLS